MSCSKVKAPLNFPPSMSLLHHLGAVLLALAGSFLFGTGVDWYLGAGSVPAPLLIYVMIVSGLLGLAFAVFLSQLTSRIAVGLIVVIEGEIILQSYTCGGFGPVCISWWSGQVTGLATLSIGLVVAIWGLAVTLASRKIHRMNQ